MVWSRLGFGREQLLSHGEIKLLEDARSLHIEDFIIVSILHHDLIIVSSLIERN